MFFVGPGRGHLAHRPQPRGARSRITATNKGMNEGGAGASITTSSHNEGDDEGGDEDHFPTRSVVIDGSYFGQINSQPGFLDAEVWGGPNTIARTLVTKSALPATITGNYTYEF